MKMTPEERLMKEERLAQLKQLRSQQNKQAATLPSRLANTNTIQAILAIGDTINNTGRNVFSTLVSKPLFGQVMPQIKSGSGPAYDAARFGTDVGLMMGGSGAAAKAATHGLNMLAKTVPKTKGAVQSLLGQVTPKTMAGRAGAYTGRGLGRVGEAGLLTALVSPENTSESAQQAAFLQSMFELAPIAAKPITASIAYVPGVEYSRELMKKLGLDFERAEKEAAKLFGQAEKAAGEGRMKLFNKEEAEAAKKAYEKELASKRAETLTSFPPGIKAPEIVPETLFQKKLGEFDEKQINDLFKGKTKEVYKKFLEDPSYKNAFGLQSQLGSRTREIKGTDAASLSMRENLTDIRKELLADIHGSLLGEGSEASKTLQKALYQYATEVSPYLRRPEFQLMQEQLLGPQGSKVSQGVLGEMNLKELENLLSKEISNVKPGQKVPERHMMYQAQKDLLPRMQKSEAMMYGNPLNWPTSLARGMGLDLYKLAGNPQFLLAAEEAKKAGSRITPGLSASLQQQYGGY